MTDAPRRSTEERSASAARRHDSAEDLFENAPCGYLSAYADGRLARVNQTFLSWTGYTRDELVDRRRLSDVLSAGSRIYHETHYAPLLRMQGSVRAIAMDVVRADGTLLPVLLNARQLVGEDGTVLGVRTSVFDASDRKEYERELLAARRRAEQATAWVTGLETVVAALAAASSVDDVCRVMASAGPEVLGARVSGVWLQGSGATGWTWTGPGDDLARDELPGADALRDGRIVTGDGGSSEDAARARLGVDGGRLLLAPLVSGDRTLGALGLVVPETGTAPDHLRLLATLGSQAGQALDRARLSDQQARVATTLQASMLPTGLPTDARLEVSACYRPAVDGMQVGGDWFDAFAVDADRVALVVGDVVGRGLHAAAAMGQLRSAVRALATVDSGPALLLQRLDDFVEDVPAAQTATLAYAELDLRDGSLVYACAGHPPPLVVTPGRSTAQLWGGRSTPLGAHFGNHRRTQAHTVLGPGSRLALYSDGLVERRDAPLDECIDALGGVLEQHADHAVAGLAEVIADAILGSGPTGDDVCLLVLGWPGSASA